MTNPLRACQTEAVAMTTPPIVFDPTQITSPENGSTCEPGAPCHTLPKDGYAPVIAFKTGQGATARGAGVHEEVTPALGGVNGSQRAPGICQQMQVRRLTPRECERLQSFKDDYTLIPFRGKPAADGPRYKALGNSMCRNVMLWIGEQVDLALWCEENL